ncbi:MAG: hypothetical protein GPI96_01975 [Microcystis aeruginosa BS13-02]|uniref:Uncharacterized protein n=1 Tax=Microcystis aeruginosa Ma_MB_S_20031200_S102 TaxID=2486254 RepID=A0A552ENN5_MICAE|nr:hypothetical protein [Microcystis aeruginosa BS13-02]TRU23883.1 MAG: hypothetical protein EWV79_11205 [Microcystis aeruginosa Ma_MB_S_20031200_S102D]TRU36082.1 MAG: hypothetical protein EWV92_12895 [Microcystis aeruginosa Ma_MB_S_20031200_S102]
MVDSWGNLPCKREFWLSYSLCDKFNLYSSDRSLCPLCLCGSFHSVSRSERVATASRTVS